MRKFLIIFFLFSAAVFGPFIIISTYSPSKHFRAEYERLEDSLQYLTEVSDSLCNRIRVLEDSIQSLSQKQLTAEQFVNLYKYNRLQKYYQICQKNPSQWKYYKGWSIRVFEN